MDVIWGYGVLSHALPLPCWSDGVVLAVGHRFVAAAGLLVESLWGVAGRKVHFAMIGWSIGLRFTLPHIGLIAFRALPMCSGLLLD
jgi:hypothetical protein